MNIHTLTIVVLDLDTSSTVKAKSSADVAMMPKHTKIEFHQLLETTFTSFQLTMVSLASSLTTTLSKKASVSMMLEQLLEEESKIGSVMNLVKILATMI